MASNYQNLVTVTIPASGTWDFDIHLSREGLKKFVLLMDYVFTAGTSGTTGLSCKILPGFGGDDPLCLIGQTPDFLALPCVPGTPGTPGTGGATVPKFVGSGYTVTMSTTPASQGGSTEVVDMAYTADILRTYPEWARFHFVNLDASKPVTLTLKASIGNDV